LKITFLGTSSGAPSIDRNVSSLALQQDQRSALWIFDCGEGTQHQVLRSRLRLSQLERLFITHLHGDHVFGLGGLLASRSLQQGGVTPVTLYGPSGLREYLRGVLDITQTRLGYPIQIEQIRTGVVYEDARVRVVCAPMRHRIEAYGYAIEEKEQPGHFDVRRAQALGIPAGPLYGRLKNGESILLADGRTFLGADFVGPPQPGRKVAFTGDTSFTENAVELARHADLLIHESTYLQEDLELAQRSMHSTSMMAANVAVQAGVKTLILTHFSTRYDSESASRMGDLLAEARAIFPNTFLAYDFWSYEIPRRKVEAP
jgi:ribonuclease Z